MEADQLGVLDTSILDAHGSSMNPSLNRPGMSFRRRTTFAPAAKPSSSRPGRN